MTEEVIYIIGQLLSITAVALGFVAYQMKTPKGILGFQIATASVFAVHYLLIGAPSAVALNLLSAVASICYYFREKQGGRGIVAPMLFASLTVVMGIFTWEGWHSALIVVGLVVNSIGLSLSNPQKTRMCVLVKSPLCLLYNIIVVSGGGIIYECAIFTSAVLGLLKNRTLKETEKKA